MLTRLQGHGYQEKSLINVTTLKLSGLFIAKTTEMEKIFEPT